MKTVVLAILMLSAVAYAQFHGHFELLIQHEVHAIFTANPGATVDECTSICDGLFDFIDLVDEAFTDGACKQACDCNFNKTCGTDTAGSTQGTTTAAHHTHPPHPSHPPHPDHGNHV